MQKAPPPGKPLPPGPKPSAGAGDSSGTSPAAAGDAAIAPPADKPARLILKVALSFLFTTLTCRSRQPQAANHRLPAASRLCPLQLALSRRPTLQLLLVKAHLKPRPPVAKGNLRHRLGKPSHRLSRPVPRPVLPLPLVAMALALHPLPAQQARPHHQTAANPRRPREPKPNRRPNRQPRPRAHRLQTVQATLLPLLLLLAEAMAQQRGRSRRRRQGRQNRLPSQPPLPLLPPLPKTSPQEQRQERPQTELGLLQAPVRYRPPPLETSRPHPLAKPSRHLNQPVPRPVLPLPLLVTLLQPRRLQLAMLQQLLLLQRATRRVNPRLRVARPNRRPSLLPPPRAH